MQQHLYRGLNVEEHQRTSGLLQRVLRGLRGVCSNLQRGRYPSQHPARRAINEAIDNVHTARIELEADGRRQHPDARVIYPAEAPRLSTDSLTDAVAGAGDGVGQVD